MHRGVQPMDRKRMRSINQNMLLNLIRSHAPISRTQLKHLSGLSQGTIMGITATLIEQQLVVEIGTAKSTGGRKAELLEISPDGGYVIGIDLREYHITGAVLNLLGNVVYSESWPASLRNNSLQAVDIIASGVESFISRAEIVKSRVLGLGCGVSGPVNAETGTSVDSWILNWHSVELVAPLRRQLNLPVFVDNAVNCLASYEKLYGHGQHYHNFLLITMGRGLGLATVIRDDLFRGAEGLGAEFGHIPFAVLNRLCECGNRGCLEAYVSYHGILNTYHELQNYLPINAGELSLPTFHELSVQAKEGNKIAQEAFMISGTYLGLGLAALVNLFNPECIIIDGGEGEWLSLLLENMSATMQQHTFSQLGRNLKIIVQQNTTTLNWARGAGCLVLRDFFALSTD